MENTRYDYSAIITRKPIKWPNNARIAVWVIPNIEHYEIDLPGLALHQGSTTLVPDVLNYAWRDYGVRVGIWRLMDVLDKYGIKGTVALNSAVCEHYPIIIEECNKRNWEFMGHGITNSRLLAGLSEKEEREVIRKTIETITKATGKPPEGWLSPALAETFTTPDILAEEGIKYLCDWCNDDQPYPMKVRKGTLISIPYSIEVNDILIFQVKNHSGQEFFEIVRDQFDALYEEGKKNGRVMAIALHSCIINLPFRHKYLDKALEYISKHKDVWFATGSEIANWYYEHYYQERR